MAVEFEWSEDNQDVMIKCPVAAPAGGPSPDVFLGVLVKADEFMKQVAGGLRGRLELIGGVPYLTVRDEWECRLISAWPLHTALEQLLEDPLEDPLDADMAAAMRTLREVIRQRNPPEPWEPGYPREDAMFPD